MALITLASAGLLFGSVMLFEGLAAILNHIEGDPEADVQVALQELVAKNQRRAFSLAAAEQAGKEDVREQASKFNSIPGRTLSNASLNVGKVTAGPPDTRLLDYVSAQLGLAPQQLSQISSPARMGDLSQMHRMGGRSLQAPQPPQRPGPQGPQQPQQPQGPVGP